MNKSQFLEAKLFGKGMLNRSEEFSKVELKHIPVMISDSGRIVCIPNTKETVHIGTTGMSGKGKGICGSYLLGMYYYMNNELGMIANDFQRETLENSLPCINNIFSVVHKILHLNSIGYPIVYVYPSNKDLKLGEYEEMFPHIKMSLPTRIVIREIEKFYKLDKSARYFTANIDKFLDCKDLEEIDEALNEIFDEQLSDPSSKKTAESMIYKIKTTFKNIFDEKITENSADESHAYLWAQRKGLSEYNNLTIQALMAAGFIPSIQTSWIRSKSWFPAYMSFIIESIYQNKFDDSYMKNKILCMYIPEIDKLWKGDRSKGNLIKDKCSLVGTNGRMAGIRMIWDAQDYDAVPDAIRSNTKYLFVLRKANAEEVRGIVKDYSLGKDIVEKILSLETEPSKGLFECVGLTANKFIIYNPKNGAYSYSSSPQKDRVIPPLCQHKVPGVTIPEVLEQYKKWMYKK